MYLREQTKVVNVGGVLIGGDNPVVVQSMTNVKKTAEIIEQIAALTDAGCEIVRLAVPDMESAENFSTIKKAVKIPIVADIHFDYRLALAAIEHGADKLRINPGNIGGTERVQAVAQAAKIAGIPIRVGVNSGSLESSLYEKYGGITPAALCESVLHHVKLLEEYDFFDIVVAIKSSNIPLTIAAHKLLCKQTDYPVHLGITEAGTPYRGTIKSAVGIGALLTMGIGNTIRVSLTGSPVEEIRVAKEILQAVDIRRFGVNIISCPTCGRCNVDLPKIADEVEKFCQGITAEIDVAVMGCVVNGPGEAKEADYGIAAGDGNGVIFKKGNIIKKVAEADLARELIGIVENDYKGGF
ncbi:MAG: flavodoxin-dependent (E)-4-hydroxy-3-methylbut-2-enyl-diphosphate synthase [Turicibacter sp.]|nr:flavodoxin-dependent (E)-4-hydroxy-3-methylbut-2-enyl-diphosphate synthase [Turicibacter sp.]